MQGCAWEERQDSRNLLHDYALHCGRRETSSRQREKERERAAAPTATAAEEKECWGERVREGERRLPRRREREIVIAIILSGEEVLSPPQCEAVMRPFPRLLRTVFR